MTDKKSYSSYCRRSLLDKGVATVIIAVTQECNRRCSFCPVIKSKGSLQLGKIAEFIDFITRINNARTYFQFQGGEPLLCWDTLRKVFSNSYAGDKIRFALTTNGSLLTKRIINSLIGNKVCLTLSIDSQKWDLDKDSARLQSILHVYKGYSDADYFAINIVLDPDMLNRIERLIEVILDKKIKNFRIFPAFYVKWSKADITMLDLTLARLAGKYKVSLLGYMKLKEKPYLNYLNNISGVPLIGDHLTLDSHGNVSISDVVLIRQFRNLTEAMRITNIDRNNWKEQIRDFSFNECIDRFKEIKNAYSNNISPAILRQNRRLLSAFNIYFEKLWKMAKE